MILLKADGIALGVEQNITLEERMIQLDRGDLLVLYTDGVTEAIDRHEQEFGEERLIALAQQYSNLPKLRLMNFSGIFLAVEKVLIRTCSSSSRHLPILCIFLNERLSG